ncbi:DnaA regulatory inactivator Hda [Rheinheimera maricola]|uniref:DnaA regulatory inactivator Hda n=1 Tax=Rheinheimera maricola TaxID=2793282 RepID=A0ABS7XE20_9GAMM|nr:DnaA regulatory inactivator Hda [Rheinheimera maricola]MBZ9613581.1 DnaA regulatory inactivator Hda [Rheinheimera maricola]
MQPLQYTLAVTLPEDETLDSFYATGQTAAVAFLKQYLHNPAQQSPVYLFGASGSGKSHLLYAACVQAQEQGFTSQLLTLDDWRLLSPRLLDDLEQLDLVCLDNIQAIAGELSWQTAVFDLYNRMAEQGKALIIVGNQAPQQLGLQLADLVSRLQACTAFQLRLLTDDDKQKLLQQKARLRGMDLPDEVARYLLNHQDRDIRALVAILDKLDKATIVHQRKLTIPFVKEILN